MSSTIKVYSVADLISSRKRTRKEIVDDFVRINREVWGPPFPEKYVWTPEKVEVQIRTCPHILYCAYIGNEMAGTLSGIYKNESEILKCTSWDAISGGGTLSTHDADGDSYFGVDLSVLPKFQTLGVPDAIMRKGFWEKIVIPNKKGAFLGARVPRYSEHSDMDIEEYVFGWSQGGRTRDPEIRLYQEAGFQRGRIVKDYIEDPESLDYGVLMFWKNRFYLNLKEFFGLKQSGSSA